MCLSGPLCGWEAKAHQFDIRAAVCRGVGFAGNLGDLLRAEAEADQDRVRGLRPQVQSI